MECELDNIYGRPRDDRDDPLPDGAIGWCPCHFCDHAVYPDDDLPWCDFCWPVDCGCVCACQCDEHTYAMCMPPPRRKLWWQFPLSEVPYYGIITGATHAHIMLYVDDAYITHF